jgi:hypothetical protein
MCLLDLNYLSSPKNLLTMIRHYSLPKIHLYYLLMIHLLHEHLLRLYERVSSTLRSRTRIDRR